ncbi:Metalloid/H+ antiporter for the transports of arsenite and antimonite [Komagataella phaffii CBS 7435]|uniref:Arsenite transporter of the plasma membrane, required for resistance to arsenic compounds n=2 Tax=Komagataella phaffii TaxID=460519 RepID=C4QWN2_KOMPG|nr:uncharacterized protein PAS_chr1-1_0281 [Komagataella phaffii GS115]AOA61129.1 GQ67_02864T0 [Komagataella phaffii]CAH2446392.1 Metalloid/H+ antiporter for the transports of arsenite and antimonite [Komagataella phaffii CBS 7435]AOA65878.1 GQ68_02383T0 [Komagataella phaffii GS115]CAY67655.1 Arsenite transporter of the plasma membrane, required for resistance to arsenic compounds [Komagataella phaffii GS115]CCA36748.1 Metalloid/H+ antiporter for the transports of arsenite and antimonite [Koma
MAEQLSSGKKIILLFKELSWLDRLLTPTIILSIIIGILISVYVPDARDKFESDAKLAGVGVPLAIGLILMMVPPLCNVSWESIHHILRQKSVYRQLFISLIINWILCPFLMLALSWMVLFNETEYRIGIIMIGIARCIAMVLVWNGLAGGDNTLCTIIVVMNSIMQIVLFAPYQIFLCYVISGTSNVGSASYSEVAESVGAFLGIPLGLGLLIRFGCLAVFGREKYEKKIIPFIEPWSVVGLVYIIIVIFIAKGHDFIQEIGRAFKCFIPLVLYFLITWFGAFWLLRFLTNYFNKRDLRRQYKTEVGSSLDCQDSSELERSKKLGYASYRVTIAQAFTAASNNFELSLAVAISVYGSGSKQSIATTFGPLLEVPVLLILTIVARYFRQSFMWIDTEDENGSEAEIEPETKETTDIEITEIGQK